MTKVFTDVEDINREILWRLNDDILFKAFQVNKEINKLSDEYFWNIRIQREFWGVNINVKKYKKSYKEIYIDLKSVSKEDLLYYVAKEGYIEVVEILLDRGADIHAWNDNTLGVAAKNGHIEVVKLLLDRGAHTSVHAVDDYALRWAAENDHIEVVELLLDNGADIHVYHDCALRFAADKGHIELVELLLDHGANMHPMEDYAFRSAAEYGHIEVVKLFLARGADRSVLTNKQLERLGL